MEPLAYFGLIFAIVFIPLGLFMLSGRGKWLIAGYNTMNAEEKAKADEKYDMNLMTKLIGVMLILIGLAFTIGFTGYVDIMFGIAIILLATFVPLSLVIIGQFTFLRRDR